jgi:MFS family permease
LPSEIPEAGSNLAGQARSLILICLAQLLAMSMWFSASAVLPQLNAEWSLSGSQQSWLTMGLQLGFVAGALLSASLGLPDRISAVRLSAVSALVAAACTAAIPLLSGFGATVLLRFLTGAALAGVYPPAMKVMASWTRVNRGLAIGSLVGALSLGSAVPHLLNAVPLFGEGGMPPWRSVLVTASGLGVIAAAVLWLGVKEGPYLGRSRMFQWRLAGRSFSQRATRLANFGYLGHMWELYAVWTWVPIYLIVQFQAAEASVSAARMAGFGVVGMGLVGSVLAGVLADRLGRTTIAIWSLVISGLCCLVVTQFAANPAALTVLCLIWGLAVVADSAQFSAAVSELSEPELVGTALTMQTCLGFLLTLLSIWLVPILVERGGWAMAFYALALGPVFGIVSMWRLRALPEAQRMASGRR